MKETKNTEQTRHDLYPVLGARALDEACPTDDFEGGEPCGKCWGDGHYMCNQCKHFRPDFKGEGWKKRDELLQGQGGIQITVL